MMIMITKLHPTNHLHNSNQAKWIITINVKSKSNEPAHEYLSQFTEMKAHISLCKCVDSPEPLLPAYIKYRCRSELRQLAPLCQHGQLMLVFGIENVISTKISRAG